MKVTLTGCGDSGGVPLASGAWGDCDPEEPRNRRTRPSLLVQSDSVNIVVDTGPDFHAQMLAVSVNRIDAILYTHGHADHTHGIDDVRAFNFASDAVIDAFGSKETWEMIEARFAYALRAFDPRFGFARPHLNRREFNVPADGFAVGDIQVRTREHLHGRRSATTYLFGDRVAYTTDVSALSDTLLSELRGIDLWILSCLREEPHPAHGNLDQVLRWVEQVRPRKTVLTHMNHTLDYRRLQEMLPAGVVPGFDGWSADLASQPLG